MKDDEKLSYTVTWYDDLASIERHFLLSYWPSESCVEMTEMRNKKLFLRKMKTNDIQESDLFIGNTITLLSRQLKVVDYADEFTKDKEQHVQEATFGLIKPSHMSEMGMILGDIYLAGLTIGKAKQIKLTGSLAEALLDDSRCEDNFMEQVNAIINKPSLALVLVGENSVETWKKVAAGISNLSPGIQDLEDQEQDVVVSSSSLRGVHCSKSISRAEGEINLFFPLKPHNNPFLNIGSSALMFNSTCCVILPHAVKHRQAGEIIQSILEAGFNISALQTFHLDFGRAEEFLEIYKNVVEDYNDMVKALISGMCMAIEITWKSNDLEMNGNSNSVDDSTSLVQQFRQFVGPRDPEIARKLRPNSLRARFGKLGAENGVHCTDLPEDAKLEIEYFFRVIQS